MPLLFPIFQKVKFITSIECGLIRITEQRNYFGDLIVTEGIYNAENFKEEVETLTHCLEIIYLTEDNSWPVTCDNYHLVDDLPDGNCQDSVIDKVRLDHLNEEEKLNLNAL